MLTRYCWANNIESTLVENVLCAEDGLHILVTTGYRTNFGLILAHRPRHWANIKPTYCVF